MRLCVCMQLYVCGVMRCKIDRSINYFLLCAYVCICACVHLLQINLTPGSSAVQAIVKGLYGIHTLKTTTRLLKH